MPSFFERKLFPKVAETQFFARLDVSKSDHLGLSCPVALAIVDDHVWTARVIKRADEGEEGGTVERSQ